MMNKYVLCVFISSILISAEAVHACVQTGFNTFTCPVGGGGGNSNLGPYMPPSGPGNSQSTSFSPSSNREMICSQSYGRAQNKLGECTKKANDKLIEDYKACPQDSEIIVSVPGFIEVKTTPNATCTNLADVVRRTTIENCKIDFDNRTVPDYCNKDGTVKK